MCKRNHHIISSMHDESRTFNQTNFLMILKYIKLSGCDTTRIADSIGDCKIIPQIFHESIRTGGGEGPEKHPGKKNDAVDDPLGLVVWSSFFFLESEAAKCTVGPDPNDLPYRIIFPEGIWQLVVR